MRLDFRILWVDDQPDHIHSFADTLRDKLLDQGFDLDVVEMLSLDQVENNLGEHVHDDGIDLVLVDFDLGGGKEESGEHVLKKIRSTFSYKDIIFYSAERTEKLRKIAYDAKLEGIYFSTRITLIEDAYLLISNLLRRVLDLDHMRGIVMAATSDIDYIIGSCLKAVNDKFNQDEKTEYFKSVIASLKEKLEGYVQDLEKAERSGQLEKILKKNHLCTSNDKLKLFLNHLETLASKESTYFESVKNYVDVIVPRRNKLAHTILHAVEGKQILEGEDGRITKNDMTELRIDLLKHRKNFQDIAVLLDIKFD